MLFTDKSQKVLYNGIKSTKQYHEKRKPNIKIHNKPVFLRYLPVFLYSSFLSLFLGDGNSKISSVYINNTHGVDDDDFYDRNLALFEVRSTKTT